MARTATSLARGARSAGSGCHRLTRGSAGTPDGEAGGEVVPVAVPAVVWLGGVEVWRAAWSVHPDRTAAAPSSRTLRRSTLRVIAAPSSPCRQKAQDIPGRTMSSCPRPGLQSHNEPEVADDDGDGGPGRDPQGHVDRAVRRPP